MSPPARCYHIRVIPDFLLALRGCMQAVIEMRKFSFVLVDERTKAELDYFQALPAQARHSIARTKVTQKKTGRLKDMSYPW